MKVMKANIFSPCCAAFGVGEAEVAIVEPRGLWLLLSAPMSGIREFVCTLFSQCLGKGIKAICDLAGTGFRGLQMT